MSAAVTTTAHIGDYTFSRVICDASVCYDCCRTEDEDHEQQIVRGALTTVIITGDMNHTQHDEEEGQ